MRSEKNRVNLAKLQILRYVEHLFTAVSDLLHPNLEQLMNMESHGLSQQELIVVLSELFETHILVAKTEERGLFTPSLLVLASVLWLSSYTHHTGVGIDHDFEREDKVIHTYSRVSWTGHGSVWLGYGSFIKDRREGVGLEKLDLAAVFFRAVQKPLSPSASLWNRVGFWYINGQSPKSSLWIGIPSWLPVLFIGLLLYRRWRKARFK